MMYELLPVFDCRKSFNKKAYVIVEGCTQMLYSYGTHILTESNGKITYITDNKNHFTQTTNRHINEFLRQRLGWRGKSKSELLNMAGIL